MYFVLFAIVLVQTQKFYDQGSETLDMHLSKIITQF